MARYNEEVPDGNEKFEEFDFGSLNNSNQVAFLANLMETAQDGLDDQGLFFWENGTLHQIIRESSPGPEGIGEWAGAGRFGTEKPKVGGMKSLNERGQAVFWVGFEEENEGGQNIDGIFLWGPPPPDPPPTSVESVGILTLPEIWPR